MYCNVSFFSLLHWLQDCLKNYLALRWCMVATSKWQNITHKLLKIFISFIRVKVLLTAAWSIERRMSKVETSNEDILDALACANRCNDKFIKSAVAYSSLYKLMMRHLSCRWLINHSSNPLSIIYIRCCLRRDSFCSIATIISHAKESIPSA